MSLYKRVYPRWSQVWKEGEEGEEGEEGDADRSHARPKGVADTTMEG